MQAKLTLSLEKEVVEQAKAFSRRQHKSLSKLVENYLRQVIRTPDSEQPVTPLVKELSGVIAPKGADKRKEEYADYLAEKYR
jgi:hypothetical protein